MSNKLEDKLLGEKTAGYCSSSDEEEEIIVPDKDGDKMPTTTPGWTGNSCNTGPKGVLRDWRLFKEHEEAVRNAREAEFLAQVTQKSLTCAPESAEGVDNTLAELEAEDEEATLREFLKKRMKQMIQSQQSTDTPTFGQLIDIPSSDQFLQAIDEPPGKVSVIIHIYEARSRECLLMNDCLTTLATTYSKIKFCKVLATTAGLSSEFKAKGVPALLVYKGGTLIGNFIRLKEEFGSEFFPGDVENFLIENGILEDPTNNVPAILKDAI